LPCVSVRRDLTPACQQKSGGRRPYAIYFALQPIPPEPRTPTLSIISRLADERRHLVRTMDALAASGEFQAVQSLHRFSRWGLASCGHREWTKRVVGIIPLWGPSAETRLAQNIIRIPEFSCPQFAGQNGPGPPRASEWISIPYSVIVTRQAGAAAARHHPGHELDHTSKVSSVGAFLGRLARSRTAFASAQTPNARPLTQQSPVRFGEVRFHSQQLAAGETPWPAKSRAR